MNILSKLLIGSTISIAAMSSVVQAGDLICKVQGGDDVIMKNILIMRSNQFLVEINDSCKSPIFDNIYRIDGVNGQDISETPTYISYTQYPLANHQLLATVQVADQKAFTGMCTVTQEM
ncbi:hypothetical protein L2719_05360 [Shewanella schlegeliana]|uniref:Uncharacterized protein n=1 Tax=Shewanella schlegeliana TaxID=190308 RepID=A0ABS1SWL3_9GAMM|nr:hypothetical protein [Shewanella schlegeliana]MBL4912928.1 hypothetical protein [Shewanella schlegeliana]MCL1108976.1 hypothetical protein [Shewanella schlegeliana]GIU23478.1 hypothetical protein TUM4433_05990 [Shewanella schlegeliana]